MDRGLTRIVGESELLNERITALLEAQTLAEVTVDLSPETMELLARASELGGWTAEQTVRYAFAYGVSSGVQRQSSPSRKEMLDEANDLGSRYIALKYQVYKLRSEVFREETHLNATASQNRTFEELIEKLTRERT